MNLKNIIMNRISSNLYLDIKGISPSKKRDEDGLDVSLLISILEILVLSAFSSVIMMSYFWKLETHLIIIHSIICTVYYISLKILKKSSISKNIKIHIFSIMVMIEYFYLFYMLIDKITILYWFILLLVIIPLTTFSYKITMRYMLVVASFTFVSTIYIFPKNEYITKNALGTTSFLIFVLILFVVYYVFVAYNTLLREYKKKNKVLFKTAYYDVMTKLPNRQYVHNEITKLIEEEKPFYMAYFNINDFKSINDLISHEIGDEVLKIVAKTLSTYKGKHDFIARVGGDEFIYIFTNDVNRSEIEYKISDIVYKMKEPMLIDKHNISIELSCSVCRYPDHGNNYKELLKAMDISYFKTKAIENTNILFYEHEMGDEANKKREFEENLSKALERNEFYVVFQPIMNANNEVSYFEALLRWKSMVLGQVSPFDFIPVAEKLGIIHDIGLFVFKKSCEFLIRVNEEFFKDCKISINVSPLQLKNSRFIHQINEIIKESKINPSNVIIELTESAFIDNSEITKDSIKNLNTMNIMTAIDDFGTGYSSFGYLTDLNVDNLKIDKVFIDGMTVSEKKSKVVKSIISIGHNMNMTVTAEGVETKDQIDFLRNFDCDFIQGYYYSKPLEEKEMIEYLNDREKEKQIG